MHRETYLKNIRLTGKNAKNAFLPDLGGGMWRGKLSYRCPHVSKCRHLVSDRRQEDARQVLLVRKTVLEEVKSLGVFPKIEVVPDAETGYTPWGYTDTNVKSFDAL